MIPSVRIPMFEADGSGAQLTLGAPVAEYIGSSGHGTPSSWQADGARRWSSSDELLRFGLALGSVTAREHCVSRVIGITAVAERAATIRRCSVRLSVQASGRPQHVDASCRWIELQGRTITNESTPFVVRWRDQSGSAFELRTPRACVSSTLSWKRGILTIEVELDAAALHPRWSFATGRAVSTAAPLRPAGWSSQVELVLRRIDAPAPAPAVLGRFPYGAEAAITITDHPDFDDEDRFRVFVHGSNGERGWLGRGLRLTKSVFAIESDSVPRRPAPTLEQPQYRALLDELHGEGNEIGPHGVNESGNVGPDRFRAALARLADRYRPDTWIDHGLSLAYCYSMGGADNPEYDLLQRLREHGISTLWSYHDVPVNAAGSLNMLAPNARDLRHAVRHSMRHAANSNYLIAAHYLRTAFLSRATGALHHAVGRALSVGRRAYLLRSESFANRHAAAWSAAGAALVGLFEASTRSRENDASNAEVFTRVEGLAWSATVYPERAVPMHQMRADDQLLFTTQEVLHLRDAYTPAAFERLVQQRGVHVAHTYLLNTLPYVAGMFSPDASGIRQNASWLTALDSMSGEVAAGRLWNPTAGELAKWSRSVQCLRIEPTSECALELSNTTGDVLHGATLMLPVSVRPEEIDWNGGPVAGSRRWNDWMCVWGDVPGHSTIVVRWDRIRTGTRPAAALQPSETADRTAGGPHA